MINETSQEILSNIGRDIPFGLMLFFMFFLGMPVQDKDGSIKYDKNESIVTTQAIEIPKDTSPGTLSDHSAAVRVLILLSEESQPIIQIDKEIIPLSRLSDELKKKDKKAVLLIVDRKVMHGDVITILNTITNAGVEEISFGYLEQKKQQSREINPEIFF
jgi:biopolymer transport protein ExbD